MLGAGSAAFGHQGKQSYKIVHQVSHWKKRRLKLVAKIKIYRDWNFGEARVVQNMIELNIQIGKDVCIVNNDKGKINGKKIFNSILSIESNMGGIKL